MATSQYTNRYLCNTRIGYSDSILVLRSQVTQNKIHTYSQKKYSYICKLASAYLLSSRGKRKKLNCGWECLEFEQFTAEQNVRPPPFALVIPLFRFFDNEAILDTVILKALFTEFWFMLIIKLDGCGFASLFDLAGVDEDKRKNVEYFICINVC